jgi:hypothetical protein
MANRGLIRAEALLLLTIVVGGGLALPAFDAAVFHGSRTSPVSVRIEAAGTALFHPAQCAVSEQRRANGYLVVGRGIIVRSTASSRAPYIWVRLVAPPSPPTSSQLSRAPPGSIA